MILPVTPGHALQGSHKLCVTGVSVVELCFGLPLEPYEEGIDVKKFSQLWQTWECPVHGWTFGHLTPWHGVQKEALVRVFMERPGEGRSEVDFQAL